MFGEHKAPTNHYPLWKYIMIVVLLVIAVIYALPNYFGESPAVQVSPKGGSAITAATVKNIEQTLTTDKLDPLGHTVSQYNTEFRFSNTIEQMKAQSAIQKALGSQYVVAINLAANTPAWLRAIGGHPMKLGLDLRGGMYFLLDIDMQTVLDTKMNNMASGLRDGLREKNIRYAGVDVDKHTNKVVIDFRSTQARDQALSYIAKNIQDVTPETTTVGKTHEPQIQLSLKKLAETKIENDAVTQTLQVMRNRVDELGVAEASVYRQGRNKVVIELPGMQDAARAKSVIGGTATLKVQMVNEKADVKAALNGNVPIGSALYYLEPQHIPYVLHNTVVITGNAITGATAAYSQEDNLPVVNVKLTGPEVSRFSEVTGKNVGKLMAIVMVQKTFRKSKHIVGGKLETVTNTKTQEHIVNVATIQSRLGANFQISGIGSIRSAQNLALSIRAGSLPAPVQIVQENQVGPTLGLHNIKMGAFSVLFAMLAVIIFILFYYSFFGLIANVALVLNLIFIVAVMSLLPGATLSLPGIAGIVLNVGMAIDANVLIFERIREELRNGTTVQAAIHAGYERAFGTIVDSNVTTLIVAVILFAVGTGAIQGFAVTLMIGILCSMFTSIVVTRALVNWIYGGRSVKWIPIGIRPKKQKSTQAENA